MIIEKENIYQKETLKDLILTKKAEILISFNERFYKKDLMSIALKSENFKNLLNKKSMYYFYAGLSSSPFLMFPTVFVSYFFLLFLPLTFFITLYGEMKWFKNTTLKKWVRNKNNIDELKEIYFEGTVADKSVLKEFALMYGEADLVNLLEKNDVVKYKDIIKFMSEEKNRILKVEKRENLIKAVKCMTNE